MNHPPDPPRDPPPDDADTHALLEDWQRTGDQDVLDRLLRVEIGRLKGVIRGRGGSLLKRSLAATDVAHEAVLGLLRVKTPPKFDNPAALRAYLWKAAWRLLLARLDRKGGKPVRLDGTATNGMQEFLATTGGMAAAHDSDRTLALEMAMNLLKPKEREILELVYMKEMDIPGAADTLGITKDAANMRVVRARRRLAEKLVGWAELIG
jgi:RNA polymerase sigma factor (sigma-70 family)